MPTSIEKLTSKDYELLFYINKFDSVSKEQINEHLKNKIDSIDYRLAQLSDVSYQGNVPINDSGYIREEFEHIKDPQTRITSVVSKKSFHITSLGKKTLQDYKCKLKSDKQDFWKKSIFVPIIVTIATTLLIDVLKLLLPLILKLLERTP